MLPIEISEKQYDGAYIYRAIVGRDIGKTDVFDKVFYANAQIYSLHRLFGYQDRRELCYMWI